MDELERINVQSQLEAVTAELLRRGIESLKREDLSSEECAVIQHICFHQSEAEPLKALIAEYTAIADSITSGVFSEQLEAWRRAAH